MKKLSGKISDLPKILLMLALFFIGLLFSFLCFKICIDKYSFFMICRVAAMLVLILFLYWLVRKIEDAWLEKRWKMIFFIWLGIMLVLQVVCGYYMEITPQWDFGEVYKAAISWAEQGNFEEGAWYFYKFPNNIGIMSFLALVFRIARVFSIGYSSAAMFVNACLNVAMTACVFLICKKLMSLKMAVFSLVIFTISLPTYFGAAVFYTDVTSMLFPVLFYYLYLRFREEENLKKQLILLACMGVVLWIGSTIKFTVMIAAIALGIEILLRCEWKQFLKVGCGVLVVYLICNTIFYQGIIYNGHLDRATLKIKSTPTTHWIMMGLQGDGGYNGADYELTDGIEDPVARREAISEKIHERLSAMGVSGWFKLALIKAEKCFSDGSYELAAFFYHGLVHSTWLNSYLVGEGIHYGEYVGLCTSVFLAFLLLMAVGCLLRAAKLLEPDGKDSTSFVVTPVFSVLGILLFLLLWETSARYIVNMIPMIYIGAALGIKSLWDFKVSVK